MSSAITIQYSRFVHVTDLAEALATILTQANWISATAADTVPAQCDFESIDRFSRKWGGSLSRLFHLAVHALCTYGAGECDIRVCRVAVHAPAPER